jgi:hypothetical protein
MLLVYEALSYYCMWPSATNVYGLELRIGFTDVFPHSRLLLTLLMRFDSYFTAT